MAAIVRSGRMRLIAAMGRSYINTFRLRPSRPDC